MPIHRKLNQQAERNVALMYLCGINCEAIQKMYGISEALIRNLIMGRRSRTWNDPLVNLYHQTDSHQRKFNAAHLYLTYQYLTTNHLREDVPHSELAVQHREEPTFSQVKKLIMDPAMERVITETKLEKFLTPTTPLEKLLNEVNSEWRTPSGVLTPLFVQKLYERYKAAYPTGEGFNFDQMVDDLAGYVLEKLKYGAAGITPAKKDIIYQQLQTLTPHEEKILKLHFGVDLFDSKTLEQIGEDFEIVGEQVGRIEDRALRRLRYHSLGRHLAYASSLVTEEEARLYIQNPPAKKTPRFIDELELSVRSSNCLQQNRGIRTVKQLVENWSEKELLKTKNLGRKSLKEIKEVLGEQGLSLRKQ